MRRSGGFVAEIHDLFVIGGGVNGCGLARDAAGRGLSVRLAEMNDLASGTSSWSTKLIHGGLRYLEFYEFRLVREALIERERLWAMAPHVVGPLRFVLPHHAGLRPAWMLRLGLFLYDHMGGRKRLPATRTIDLTADEAGRPLKPGSFARGFEYSDCFVDDARLVILNARDAARRGARIHVGEKVVGAAREAGVWRVTVENVTSGARSEAMARILVNAAGPWVGQVLNGALGRNAKARVRLVRGSHIVTRRLYEHDRAYIFQNADGRIVFAIPYQDDFTLIGTTDVDHVGDPAEAAATPAEIAYLCEAVSVYFRTAVAPDDVVWAFSGVRPLYDDGASEAKAATRDYVFEVDARAGAAPLLSIFGGKITTYRRLAEEALERLKPHLRPHAGPWTASAALPGGDFPVDGLASLTADLMRLAPFLDAANARRLVRAYGAEAAVILGGARTGADLGEHFGAGLTAREVDHLTTHEWARTADDVLWRRSKLGLRVDEAGRTRLAAYMGALKSG